MIVFKLGCIRLVRKVWKWPRDTCLDTIVKNAQSLTLAVIALFKGLAIQLNNLVLVV